MTERGREIRGRGEQGKNGAEKKGGAHLLALASCWSLVVVLWWPAGQVSCSGTSEQTDAGGGSERLRDWVEEET